MELERVFLQQCGLFFLMDADTKRYVRHLKIGRTSMISGRLLTSVSQNFDVLSIFLRR